MKSFLLLILLSLISLYAAQENTARYQVSLEDFEQNSIQISQSEISSLVNLQFSMVDRKSGGLVTIRDFKVKVPSYPVFSVEGNTITDDVMQKIAKTSVGKVVTFFDFNVEGQKDKALGKGEIFVFQIQ